MGFTAPETPARGTERLVVEAPTRPPFSLLSIVKPILNRTEVRRDADGLPRGLHADYGRCVRTGGWDNCPPPDAADKGVANEADLGLEFYPFMFYVERSCMFGAPNMAEWFENVKADLDAATPWAYSHQLWTGDINRGGSTDSPSLATVAVVLGAADQTPEAIAAVTAVNPRDAIGMLAQSYADSNNANGGATFHSPPVLTSYMRSIGTYDREGVKLLGPGGEDVSTGPGYTTDRGPYDNVPDEDEESESGESGEDVWPPLTADGETWIYVSGPIHGDVGLPWDAADPKGSLRAGGQFVEGNEKGRTNEAQMIVDRRGLFWFDPCSVFAVKVRIPSAPELG